MSSDEKAAELTRQAVEVSKPSSAISARFGSLGHVVVTHPDGSVFDPSVMPRRFGPILDFVTWGSKTDAHE